MSRLEIIRSGALAAAPTGTADVRVRPSVVERLLRTQLQVAPELEATTTPLPFRQVVESAMGPTCRTIAVRPRRRWQRRWFQGRVWIRSGRDESSRVTWSMDGWWRQREFEPRREAMTWILFLVAGVLLPLPDVLSGEATWSRVLSMLLFLLVGGSGLYALAAGGRRMQAVAARHATQLSEAIHATLAEAESIRAEPGQLSVAEPAEAGGDLALVEADAPRS